MTITVVDQTGQPRLPARLHVHRHGRRARRPPPAPGARPARPPRVSSWSARSRQVDEARADRPVWPTASDSPTTTWSWPPARGSCPRRSSTSTRRPITSTRAEAALELRQRARRVQRRAHRHRHRRHALQVPAGAARGRVPDRGRAARARAARAERDPLLLAHRPGVHHRERVRDGHADPGARASSCTRSSTSRRSIRSARSSRASRARSCRTTCSSWCRRTRASSS